MDEDLAQKLRDHLDASMRKSMKDVKNRGSAIVLARLSGMAEMVAIALGTDRHDEYNESSARMKEGK
jgi:hypothetical protein